ncbi:MAG: flagellar basal body P-ring formation chaperone FlgA [Pseudomonadota bacterium]|nr:flagellar basal body P-ring formation chaperone FlgA [Pseudomonadota bacterium]
MYKQKQHWIIIPALLVMLFFSGMGMAAQSSTPGAAQYPWQSRLMLLLDDAVRGALPKVHELKINEVRSLSTVAARIPASVHNPSFSLKTLGHWNRNRGEISLQVMISSPAGKSSSCWLRVFISGKCEVIVAKRSLERGSSVRWRDVTAQLLDARKVNDDCLVDFSRGAVFEVVRKIVAGQPLKSASLRPYRLVKRGEMVTVVLEREGIRIETKGTAMANGSKNEVVMVKNPESRRLYQAQIIAAGQVRVVY